MDIERRPPGFGKRVLGNMLDLTVQSGLSMPIMPVVDQLHFALQDLVGIGVVAPGVAAVNYVVRGALNGGEDENTQYPEAKAALIGLNVVIIDKIANSPDLDFLQKSIGLYALIYLEAICLSI